MMFIELPLIVVGGLLGSSHCVGMCGPFAVVLSRGAKDWKNHLCRQIAYTGGRIFTYATLGSIAGYAGWRLVTLTPLLRNTAGLLAIMAGIVLIYQGCLATGLLRRRVHRAGSLPCIASPLLATFLRSHGWMSIFLAGVLTGLLPCGLVYGFLTLSASTSDFIHGALLMSAFGMGTAPIMILTGAGSGLLNPNLVWRKRLHKMAAMCVMLAGVLSIARGAGFVEVSGRKSPTGCPACYSSYVLRGSAERAGVAQPPAVGRVRIRKDPPRYPSNR